MKRIDVTEGHIITDRQVSSAESTADSRKDVRLAIDGKLYISAVIERHGWIRVHRILAEEFGALKTAKAVLAALEMMEENLKADQI